MAKFQTIARSAQIMRRDGERGRRGWAARAVVVATAAMTVSGCAEVIAPSGFEGREPAMRPEAFFVGETQSTGVLESAGGAPVQRFTVEGRGRILADGSLRLDQSVAFEGEPARTRTWIMSRLDVHHYAATLSDASAPLRLEAYGNLLHLSYAMKGLPLGRMEQWLYLQPDGRTVVNEAVVRVAGAAVRRLSERISKVEAATPTLQR